MRRLDSSCGESCPSSYFGLSSAIPCHRCHHSCKECVDKTEYDCRECFGTNYLNIDSRCVEECPLGTYHKEGDERRGLINRCVWCIENCLVCTDGRRCQLCDKIKMWGDELGEVKEVQLKVREERCEMDCNLDGWYTFNNTRCDECASNCADCSTSNPIDCRRCLRGFLMRETTRECVFACPRGEYNNGQGWCMRCHKKCLHCVGPLETDCVTCHTNSYKPQVGTIGKCLVAPRYYYDKNDEINRCFD